jgi:hypothetical protein
MARINDASEGDDWVDVDDESEPFDPGEDERLSPIEGLVSDQEDAVDDLFDTEASDEDED